MEEQNPIVRISNSLRELNQTFFQTTRREAEACGTTQIQHLVLRLLKQYPMIGLNELSELMHTGASTASGVVDRLVHAGLIERDRLETDRRAVVLKLSPEGERLVEVTSERLLDRLSPLLSLPEEDVDQLLRIHGQIVQILQKAREES
ncbi:MarR family transcriptional regulator [Cohnella pontilimi]|uniref:MarR family transcriptional regulator n=1 Tax=Cohnella pontilimi TaxID=2564100 RepID=A0A4U0FEI9_9BACL|nr:MarR family transcriptional regulator [Cohnella pontilimi]TJY43218.1 MarR family transcriptional regulator [Cohnella pontilimi]